MSDDYEFKPVRRRWFAERTDFGRKWIIVPAFEDAKGALMLCHILSREEIERETREPMLTWPRYPVFPGQHLFGMEPPSSHFTADEAQDLINALWESGLRPSRK